MSTAQQIPDEPLPGLTGYVKPGCPWRNKDGLTLQQPVFYKGVKQHYKVCDMLPERRWVVQRNGELISQAEFEQQYAEYLAHTPGGIPSTVDIRYEPVDNVAHYASRTVDAQGHIVEIGFDPNKPAANPLEAKYNQQGEVSERFMLQQRQDTSKLARIDTLMGLHKDGLLTDAQLALKMSELLVAGEDPPAEPEPEKPVPLDEMPPEPLEGQTKVYVAPCGKQLRGAVHLHVQHCRKDECVAERESKAAEVEDSG